MTLLTSIALVATAFSSYMTVRRASRTVVRGQGEAIIRPLLRDLLNMRGAPTQEELDDVVSRLSGAGLRYIALFDATGRFVIDAGAAQGSGERLAREFTDAAPGAIVDTGGHIRMYLRPPPELLESGAGPGGQDGLLTRQGGAIIEFRPFIAQQLQGEAGIALGVGLVAAALLAAGALVVWRLIVRTEATAARSEQEQRLAALGTMSAVLAHEIRNPLASLKGHAQLVVEGVGDDGPLHGMAQRVVDETLRLEALTANLIDFARTGQIERRPTRPAELVQRACDECDAGRCVVNCDAAPEKWALDPTRMHQVLVNVLRNAVQASPGDAPIDLAVSARDGRLIVTIRDRGPGLADDMMEQLFEPFVTTRVRGAGLGLSIAERIIALHGGTITARNHPEGGAVFQIEIPGS